MVDHGSHIERLSTSALVAREPEKVDLTLLNQLIGHDLIPVLAPLATSAHGQTLNMNADTFAGAVAGALKAKRLLLLTDVPGVLDKSKKLIPELSVKDAQRLIADGTIAGGMIPKVETCIYALEQGVEGVVIIDGKTPHAVLLELFTNQGTGTLMLVTCRSPRAAFLTRLRRSFFAFAAANAAWIFWHDPALAVSDSAIA